MKKILWISILALYISGCASLPKTFTTKSVMSVHQGMSSDDIINKFGNPKNINVTVCGTVPDQWNCTIWQYGDRLSDYARFTFQNNQEKLVLNSFRVNRD